MLQFFLIFYLSFSVCNKPNNDEQNYHSEQRNTIGDGTGTFKKRTLGIVSIEII